MTSVVRTALRAAFLIAALTALVATGALVHASWLSIVADPAASAPADGRSYTVAFLCVVAGAAVALLIARRLRDSAHFGRDDEPALWI